VKKPSLLREVSIPIHPDCEDVISATIERVFKLLPSFYVNEDTKETTALFYLDHSKLATPALRKKIAAAMAALAEGGFPSQKGPVHVRRIRHEDWANSWKRHFKPIVIGRALLIKPSWNRRRAKPGQIIIVLDPGLSFGTGQHATTRFCLEQLAALRRPLQKQSFLDIGTGSGILAIAAAKLGYKPVRAFDFDPDAVRTARENSAANGTLRQARPVRQDLTKLGLTPARPFDMVCANLTYDILLAHLERITTRVAPEGALVLSGILVPQFDQVVTAYGKAGFKLLQECVEGEWRSGLFSRGSISKSPT
jgi:ribosomal protein L11 methyltransferase